MAKKLTDTGASSGPRSMSDAQRDHFKGLVTSTLDNAVAGGHGHAVGSQGPRGHKMVESDHAKQAGGYIRQGALAKVPQSTDSDGSGSANANDPATKDYGTVDVND